VRQIIVGIPEMVADRLMQLRDAPGLDGILAKLNCGTRISNNRIMNSPQLLCEKVKPRFH
jgi:hypothetical protein